MNKGGTTFALNDEPGGSLPTKGQDEQNIKSLSLIPVLSRMDNYWLFVAAKKGVKYSPRVVEKMGLSRKRYYIALSQLNKHGLIRKDAATGMSIHTTLGEMIWRCILEMKTYEDNSEELRMIDTLKQTGQFTPDRIVKFLEKITDDKLVSSNFGTFEMVWSYDAMVSVLLELIRHSSNEILVATRMLSEEVISALRAKITHDMRIQILSDISLVEACFGKQGRTKGNFKAQNDGSERAEVVDNAWYPDSGIERRITHVPFGMIIIDSKEVGLELVNAHNLLEFSGGFIIQDERIAQAMKSHYQKLWKQSQEFAGLYKGRNTETSA